MILYKTKNSEVVRVDGNTVSENTSSIAKYTTTIEGNGTDTVFTITHSLNTQDILFEMNDGNEPVLIDYVALDKNKINITFAIAPTNDETYNIKIYGVLGSDNNSSSSSNGDGSGNNNDGNDNNGNNSEDSNTIDPSIIGIIENDWDYTLNETNNIITLNHYTGSDTDVTVYSYYKINDKVYKTQLKGKRTSDKHIFTGKSYIRTITFNNDLDTSNVTDMSCMFKNCYDLISINFGNFDTSNVTDMSSMFEQCENLKNISIDNFDTSKVRNMKLMFYNCENLISLYLTNFDTSNVTSMNRMFCGCKNLTSIYVEADKWITTNANTEYMFLDCGTEAVTYI